jgi:hypothetical protein
MTFGELLKRILRCEHDWIDATCTTPKTCKLCGITEGEALGHIEEVIEGKAATCEETGLTDGVRCSRCGEILVEQQIIPIISHNFVEVSRIEADCENDGKITYKCSLCGEEKFERIPATGHKYADPVVTKPATCTEDGIKTYVCINDPSHSYDLPIEAFGHNHIITEITKQPTCTETGIKTHTCDRCGDSYEEVIPATGHKAAAAVKENEVAAQCETTGSYDLVTYCSVCGEELGRASKTIPALGHDYGDWVITKQPEVGVPGEQTKTCKRCGHVITEEIPALPQPDEPIAFRYYTGPVSEENAFDYPDYWEEMGYDPQERAQHYFNNMTPVEINSWDDLVGQKVYKIANQLADDPVTGYAGEETNTYSAIAIDSNYEVVAWSTDEAGSYPATAIRAFEMNNGYTIYYAEDPIPASTTYDYYITIAKK